MWNTPLLVSLTGIAVIYTLLVQRLSKVRIYHKQPLFFFLGLGLLYFSIGSPLTTLSHLSFSLHMIQMSILYFVIPPILIIGIPSDLFQRKWRYPIVKNFRKWFLAPKIALVVFSVLFLIYHLPIVLNIFSQNPLVHNASIFLLFMLSLGMWWPMVSPDPMHQFGIRQKKRYAILSGVLLMPACLLFIFSALTDGINNPFFTQITAHLCLPSSITSSHLLPPLFNTKYDQAIAGLLMLGIHKMTLMGTSRINSGSLNAQEDKWVS